MSDQTKGISDSSLARMAGNIAAGIAQRVDVWPGDHGNQVLHRQRKRGDCETDHCGNSVIGGRMSHRKGFLEVDGDNFLVGAKEIITKDECDERGRGPYVGPVARVSHDDSWVHIVTDDYEGAAMLNIEALPYLRKALSRIAKKLRKERSR